MFDPARKREAYLPRTNPLGKSERLYSRHSSPEGSLTRMVHGVEVWAASTPEGATCLPARKPSR